MTNPGLEGVVVADTAISEVDGERGRLVIAGADVEQLAGATSFEGAARRVLAAGGADPTALGDAAFGAARSAAWEIVPRLGDALDHPDGMDALRTALAHLRPPADDTAAAVAAIGAAACAIALPLGALLARGMIRGMAGMLNLALDAYLVTVIDHAMCASTFTARVIASTASDLISAVVGAVGALKGPLHGGAPGPVLDMLDAIGAPDHAEPWLLGELAAGRRIMGMGHRVYRVRDPRAAVLEEAVRPLASPRLALARGVERAAAKILHERKPERSLAANVEFYTAVLLDAVGLPREQFSATFAVSRIAGWSAHVLEQRRTGRLIRPASHYIGAMP